jgi:large subunit ribosomal protein L4e
MRLKILTLENQEKGKIDLPIQFKEHLRLDIIKRAVLVIQSNNRQPYGTDPDAGKRHATTLSKRRRDYKGSYGMGISRTPRKTLSRRGTRMYWVGAEAPNTVGGRRAHPPKAEKIWAQKINKKERRKAIRSALSATMNIELVKQRGHLPSNNYPFIIEDKIESLEKTKAVKDTLTKLGLEAELNRASKKTIRAGKGKMRGRKYRKKKGPLLVVSKDCKLQNAAKNIPGIEIANVKNLNAQLLAPGAKPGRLTIFTESAIKELEKNKLFI